MIGMVMAASTELIAVSVMLRATSPRKRWLNRLAVVPPGGSGQQHHADGEQGVEVKYLFTSPNATSGSTSTCSTSATTPARQP